MRGVCAAALVLAGCGDPQPVSPRAQYDALEARVEIDCGVYERNYTPDGEPFPEHLCGDAPGIACINDAIAGSKIAKLKYTYPDPATGNLRENNFYAGDGAVTWIGFYEQVSDGPNWWHAASCSRLEATPYQVDGMACWKLLAVECE